MCQKLPQHRRQQRFVIDALDHRGLQGTEDKRIIVFRLCLKERGIDPVIKLAVLLRCQERPDHRERLDFFVIIAFLLDKLLVEIKVISENFL